MMRFLLLLSLVAFCSCARPDIPVQENPTEAAPDTLRILAIGNSFSSDAVEQYLWELFDAAGIPAVVANMSAPGSYLSHHWDRYVSGEGAYRYFKRSDKEQVNLTGKTFMECVGDEKWTYISLQQASDLSGLYDTYFPYLPDLMGVLKKVSDAEIVLHQTWAYPANSTQAAFANYGNDQMTMYEAIVDAISRAAKECDIKTVIPVGTAIQNGRTTQLGDTFNRDGLHLEMNYGRYLAACVWFETLSGKPVVGNAYRPETVTQSQALICQKAAHDACLHPNEVTAQ